MTARVLHTSDWHLGRQIGRHRRDAEFAAVLAEIVEIAADFSPDLVVHSGDLFDGHHPSFDDMQLAADTLRQLGEIAPTVVVAGNHDTTNVLRFLQYLLTDMGTRDSALAQVRFATDARPDKFLLAEYPAADGELTLRIGALPYLHPNRFAYDFDEPATATASYAEQMRVVQTAVCRRLTANRDPQHDVTVFAAHLFVEGSTPSYSEKRLSINTDYAVGAVDLAGIDYGALGHIHKPQQVAHAGFPARYAGSPLQLDFGETRDIKSVVLAEIAPGKEPRFHTEPLNSGRRLVHLTGTLEEMTQRADRVGDAWVKVVVDVDGTTTSLPDMLKAMLPQATIVDIQERRPGAAERVLNRANSTADLPGVEDLLRDYLPGRGTTGASLEHIMATFSQLQTEPDPTEPGSCREEDLLTAAIAGQDIDTVGCAGLLIATQPRGSEVTR